MGTPHYCAGSQGLALSSFAVRLLFVTLTMVIGRSGDDGWVSPVPIAANRRNIDGISIPKRRKQTMVRIESN
jgi:hypothetical protein